MSTSAEILAAAQAVEAARTAFDVAVGDLTAAEATVAAEVVTEQAALDAASGILLAATATARANLGNYDALVLAYSAASTARQDAINDLATLAAGYDQQ